MQSADDLLSRNFEVSQVAGRSNGLFRRDSTFDTLPHSNPFITSGLRYAAPPVEWDADRAGHLDIFSPTSSFTFAVDQSGDNINTLFPQAALIASQQITQASVLLAVSLSFAVRNQTGTGAIGLFVLIDNRAVIGLGGNSDILVGAIIPSAAAAQQWSDQRNNSFSLDVAPMIKANQSVSLYACCANQATDLVWGMVTFKYVVIG